MATSKSIPSAKSATAKAVDEQLESLPTWKRNAIGLLANIVVVGAGLYVGMSIVTLLTNAAFVLTGSAFIAWMIYFVGYMFTWLAALGAGFLVQNMIIEGGAAKIVAAKFDSAKSRASGWFSAIKLGA